MYAQHTNKIDEVWSKLTAADRVVLVGHSRDALTNDDRAKVAKVLHALGVQARQARQAPDPRRARRPAKRSTKRSTAAA